MKLKRMSMLGGLALGGVLSVLGASGVLDGLRSATAPISSVQKQEAKIKKAFDHYDIEDSLQNRILHASLHELTGRGVYGLSDILKKCTLDDLPFLRKSIQSNVPVYELEQFYASDFFERENFTTYFAALAPHGVSNQIVERLLEAGANVSTLPALTALAESGETGWDLVRLFKKYNDPIAFSYVGTFVPMGYSERFVEKLKEESVGLSATAVAIAEGYKKHPPVGFSQEKNLLTFIGLGIDPTENTVALLRDISWSATGVTLEEYVSLRMRELDPTKKAFLTRAQVPRPPLSRRLVSRLFGSMHVTPVKLPPHPETRLFNQEQLVLCGVPKEYTLTLLEEGKELDLEGSNFITRLHRWGVPQEEVVNGFKQGQNPDEILDSWLPKHFEVPSLENTTSATFSGESTWEEIYADGSFTISFYRQPLLEADERDTVEAYDNAILADIDRLTPYLAQRKIKATYLTSETAFRKAIASNDVVIFLGHANCGKGINLGGVLREGSMLRLGEEEIAIPDKYADYIGPQDTILRKEDGLTIIMGGAQDLESLSFNCSAFIHLSCRSFPYFSPTIGEAVTTYVGTNYASGLSSRLIIEQTLRTAALGGDLGAIVQTAEEVNGTSLFEGIQSEREVYKDKRKLGEYPNSFISVK